METEKPFKTIEVLDLDTSQTCKIACMSCIRGHRTTSCGIPVCRTKIFWTVKRPGRPSNSCTCRFNASGVCKCVTTIPKCPHKSKKGEKRSSECRCDEQGRFCCLLDAEHWDQLMALQKPSVKFQPNKEALEAWQHNLQNNTVTSPSTPAMSYYASTPQQTSSCCGTSTTSVTPRMSRSIAPSPRELASPPQSLRPAPRFGFMGVGAPMGPNTTPPADVLAWNDDPIPQEAFSSIQSIPEPVMESSCCSSNFTNSYEPQTLSAHEAYTPIATSPFARPYTSYQEQPPLVPSAFDYNRWQNDYLTYQFPNAICQNCGLNGCTCRSCPPVMQNFGTTSWAQSCGRRHARIAPAPPPVLAPVLQQPQQDIKPPQEALSHQSPTNGVMTQEHEMEFDLNDPDTIRFDHDFGMPDQTDPLHYNEFIINELDRPVHIQDEAMFNG